MMFENQPLPEPTWKAQLVAHLPIIGLGIGVAAMMVALHVAVVGAAILAGVHVVVALGALFVRQRRSKVTS